MRTKSSVLSDADVERIAEAVARKMKLVTADSDPWLSWADAAAYLTVSRRTFDRMRRAHPESLKPCSDHPLRWSRNALDVFKMSRGVLPVRAGRRRKEAIAA